MNQKRTLSGLLGGVALMLLVLVPTASAQIWTEFDIAIENRLYQPLIGGTAIPRAQFVDLFNSFVDPNDGVTQTPIPLGFTFEYDGQTFDRLYISINGFASFQGRFITNDPTTLFKPTNGPNLTLAPYFGDHYYRTNGIDIQDPSGRPFTPTTIKWSQLPGSVDPSGRGRRAFVVEWENLNINYFFDANDPGNPFAPNRQAQAPSIASFQLWLYEADSSSISRRGTIEFHYGDAGTNTGVSIVKFSGASVGIEDEPAVPNGNTTWINAVTYAETFNKVLARTDMRLTSNWPPTGLPGRIFVFTGDPNGGSPGWGDGDANLTQIDPNISSYVRADQRLFVSMADVMRILRHKAGRNVEFDSARFRHGYHGDVNHNGRYYYSTSNYNNTGDSMINGQVVRYRVAWPVKSTNDLLPFPIDNSFNGFFFDADEFDAALIMDYLAAKLPVLPWLPDTLPHFTGKVIAGATNIDLQSGYRVAGNRVEIPVRLNGVRSGAVGIRLEAAPGTRILDVITPEENDFRNSMAVAGDTRVAIAAAGQYGPDDIIATIIVEADDNGNVGFDNVLFNEVDKGAMKFNVAGNVSATTGSLQISNVVPNPVISNGIATFNYTVPSTGAVEIRIYDVLGNVVATIVDGVIEAGTHAAVWNPAANAGHPAAAGTYYVRMNVGGQSIVAPIQVAR